MQMKLATAALLGLVLVAAAACTGSSGPQTDPPESESYSDLSAGKILTPGTYRLTGAPDAFLEALDEVEEITIGPPDSQDSVGGLRLRCTTDSASNCSVTIHDDESFTIEGTIAVVSAGGTFPMTAAERQITEANKRAEEAERRRREAEQAEQEAERERQAAEEARQEEEEKRQAAEAERNRLAAEAEKRQKAADTERARVAISGTQTIGSDSPAPTLDVAAIKHGAPVRVTTPPQPFTTTTSRSGRWSITSHTDVREAMHHTVEIYTDVEAPSRDPFRTSPLNEGTNVGPSGTTAVIDGTGRVSGFVNIVNADHGSIAASGAFPRPGPAEPFNLVDRGLLESEYSDPDTDSDGTVTDAELETAGITRAQYNQYRADRGFRVESRFPARYAYTTSGTLQGASGTYRCNGATATATCTVENRGGSFEFDGDWDFIPSSGTVQIVVPDAHYMWFGWWAQRTVEHPTPDHPTDIWAFQAKHGGTHPVSDLSAATGPATYQGPAAGHYAVYEPDTGDSSIGSFTASATLQADFGDGTATGTVSGSITGFSNDSGWSLGLKQSAITGGSAGVSTDGVTWTIDGIPDDSGAWEGQFYNNLDTDGTVTYPPHGIAGTFKAAYDPSGVGARAALIGAFGAHRPQ